MPSLPAAPDRRALDNRWKNSVDNRLNSLETSRDSINENLEEILSLLRASKLGLDGLKWLAVIGSAIAVIWAAFHGSPAK